MARPILVLCVGGPYDGKEAVLPPGTMTYHATGGYYESRLDGNTVVVGEDGVARYDWVDWD